MNSKDNFESILLSSSQRVKALAQNTLSSNCTSSMHIHDNSTNQHLQHLITIAQLFNAEAIQEKAEVSKVVSISNLLQLMDTLSESRTYDDDYSRHFIAKLRVSKPYILSLIIKEAITLAETKDAQLIITKLFESIQFWLFKFKDDVDQSISPEAIMQSIDWKLLAMLIVAGVSAIDHHPIPDSVFAS